MKCDDVTFSEEVTREMIRMVSNEESGVRTLKQAVDTIISKAYFLYTCQQSIKTSFVLPEKYYPILFPFKVDSFILRTFLKDFSKKLNPSVQHMYI